MVLESDSIEKARGLLKQLFRSSSGDLDFGIFRIMNLKRAEIAKFIDEDLVGIAESEFREFAKIGKADLEKKLELLRDEINSVIPETIDDNWNVLKNHASPKVQEFLRVLQKYKKAEITEEQIQDVFNHVFEFFSRYYDAGDFISRIRYGGRDKYYVPYNGEDVLLHWDTADHYYIKTSEYFTNYSFRVGSYRVSFVLKDAETEINSAEGGNKYFFPASRNILKLDETNKELEINFVYRRLNEEESKEYGKGNTQDKIIALVVSQVFSNLSSKMIGNALQQKVSGKEITLLEQNICEYVRRNTVDYFIHKNLKSFLERELEFYLKTELFIVEKLGRMNHEEFLLEQAKLKTIQNITSRIIEFLAQIENFEKRLWEKKKFVVKTEYIITLDKLPKELLCQVLMNKEQMLEWEQLGFGIVREEKDLYIEKHQTLDGSQKSNFKKLPVDTKHFNASFRDKLLEQLSKEGNLEHLLDGVLIKSENWQALNLLQEKYKGAVKCIYIDPPFNSKTSEILYKNDYKHSSWLSLMENRLAESKAMLRNDGCCIIAIDENEQERLGLALESIFPDKQKTCVAVVHNPGGIQGENFSYCHEYAYFLYPIVGRNIGLQDREDNPDIRPLRNVSKGEHLRETAANCFYPIVIKDVKIVEFGDVCEDSFHPASPNVLRKDGSIEVYPIDPQGNERKWVFARQSVEAIRDELSVEYNKQRGIWDIIRKKTKFNYKTVWTDKRYNSNIYGSKLLNNILGEEKFSFPKSLYNVYDCISATTQESKDAIVLDYFAGSGTTAHATMLLNKKDGGRRKFILVEMADYFDTIIIPRVKKICYSLDWQNGKPMDIDGCGGFFKYQAIEQYEDALNNIVLRSLDKTVQQTLGSFKDYIVKYMLDYETRDSLTFSISDKFTEPFDYKIKVGRPGDKEEYASVDLLETFNYLLGISVRKMLTFRDNARLYSVVVGEKGNDTILIIWRNVKDIDLERDKKFIEVNILSDIAASVIYINGDSFIENANPIEARFKQLMGA